jgi:hypothetical protein
MKICPLVTELFIADGQTDTQKDRTKLIVIFRNFGSAHKDYNVRYRSVWLSTQLAGREILQTKVPM